MGEDVLTTALAAVVVRLLVRVVVLVEVFRCARTQPCVVAAIGRGATYRSSPRPRCRTPPSRSHRPNRRASARRARPYYAGWAQSAGARDVHGGQRSLQRADVAERRARVAREALVEDVVDVVALVLLLGWGGALRGRQGFWVFHCVRVSTSLVG